MNFYLSSLDSKKSVLRTVISLLLGIIFCISPNLVPKTLVVILGVAVMFIGIVSFLTLFTNKGGKPVGINYFNLAISLLAGLALLIFPEFFIKLLMVLLGIILIVCGIGQISSFTSVKKWGVHTSFIEYAVAVLLMLLGVVICFNPFSTQTAIFILFGIGSIVYGLVNLVSLIRIRKKLEKQGKKVSHGNIEDVDYTIED